MKNSMMYKELAIFYDSIYASKDYKKESIRIKALISKYKKSNGNSLLEVACGTGRHLQYLKKEFSCTAVDLNEGMLKIARKRVPEIKFKKGDMINFKLKRKFDIILCLFSSIGYVKTYKNLEKTLKNFSEHAKVGGVTIIEPWFTKAQYMVGAPHMTTYDGKDVKIARLSVSEAKNNVSIIDMYYLIAERNKRVKYFISREKLGMFEIKKTLRMMRSAGFDAKFLSRVSFDSKVPVSERGLFVGVKRPIKKLLIP